MNHEIIQGCVPVFLPPNVFKEYYDGYSNSILWPLLHYREMPKQANLESMFAAYKQANQKFVDVVYEHYKSGDVIWCHDYHLMHYKQAKVRMHDKC
jgi:trehalose 6-phosphate synthase/phosphatase